MQLNFFYFQHFTGWWVSGSSEWDTQMQDDSLISAHRDSLSCTLLSSPVSCVCSRSVYTSSQTCCMWGGALFVVKWQTIAGVHRIHAYIILLPLMSGFSGDWTNTCSVCHTAGGGSSPEEQLNAAKPKRIICCALTYSSSTFFLCHCMCDAATENV